MGIRVLYLVHDLSDAAVEKRVRMMLCGVAGVTLMGFRRSEVVPESVAGVHAIDLGRTENANFLQRAWAVFRVIMGLRQYRDAFVAADVVVARNLEMLAIGARGCALKRGRARLVYELLDIHRLLLDDGIKGKIFRFLEGWFGKRVSLVITSSPAFVREYLEKRSRIKARALLVENKVFTYDPPSPEGCGATSAVEVVPEIEARPPWVIGWFGVLRCRKSFEVLHGLSGENVFVVLQGKPALDEIPDFHEAVENAEHMEFLGAYKNPDDLEAMYGGVHFSWAIDMYEEGLNSSWLLPNRVYEGGLYEAVPIALEGLETGRFLEALGVGVLVEDTDVLNGFFEGLDAEGYGALKMASRAVSKTHWACGAQDCVDLVEALKYGE